MNQLPLQRNRLLVIALSTVLAMLAFDFNSASAMQDESVYETFRQKGNSRSGKRHKGF